MNKIFNLHATISIALLLFSNLIYAQEDYSSIFKSGMSEHDNNLSLWSTSKDCFSNNPVIISINSFKNTYKIALCVKYGCRIPVPGFGKKTQPYNYKNDPRLNWVTNSSFDIVINGNNQRFYECKQKEGGGTNKIDRYADSNEIKKYITGRWKRRKSSYGIYFFGSDGEYNNFIGSNSMKYIIDGHKIKINYPDGTTKHTFNVVSISSRKMMLELITENSRYQTLYELDYQFKRLTDETFNNKIFYMLNSGMGTISDSEKNDYSVTLNGDYESGMCDISYFSPSGDYLEVTTQACYRKKGERNIHVDTKHKYLKFYIDYGKWYIKDNEIVIEKLSVDEHRNPDLIYKGKFNTESRHLEWDDQRIRDSEFWDNPLDLSVIPEIYEFYDPARAKYYSIEKN